MNLKTEFNKPSQLEQPQEAPGSLTPCSPGRVTQLDVQHLVKIIQTAAAVLIFDHYFGLCCIFSV